MTARQRLRFLRIYYTRVETTAIKASMPTSELHGSFADLSNIVGTADQSPRSKLRRVVHSSQRRVTRRRQQSEESCPEESPDCSSSAESKCQTNWGNFSGQSKARNAFRQWELNVYSNGRKRRIASRNLRHLCRRLRECERARLSRQTSKSGSRRYSFCNVCRFFQPWLWRPDKYGSRSSDSEGSNFSDIGSSRSVSVMVLVFVGFLALIVYTVFGSSTWSGTVRKLTLGSNVADKIEEPETVPSCEAETANDVGLTDDVENIKDLETYLRRKAWQIMADWSARFPGHRVKLEAK